MSDETTAQTTSIEPLPRPASCGARICTADTLVGAHRHGDGMITLIDHATEVIAKTFPGWDGYDDDMRDDVNAECMKTGRTIAKALAAEGLIATTELVETIAAQAELDELPIGSVVLDRDGDAWQRRALGWKLAGVGTFVKVHHILAYAPLTILHTA